MELANKRVLVVGLGKSGLAAARFLKERGARVTVSDARPATLIAELPGLVAAGITVESGSHGLLTFRRQDLIVVSPGVPMSTPELKQVRAMGMQVIGELELGVRFLVGEVVAITGSNGKTTTTTLMGEILKADRRPTLVGGNIGRPVTEMVAESIGIGGGDSAAESGGPTRGSGQQAGPSAALRFAQDDSSEGGTREASPSAALRFAQDDSSVGGTREAIPSAALSFAQDDSSEGGTREAGPSAALRLAQDDSSEGRVGEADSSASLRNDKQEKTYDQRTVWSVLEVSSFQLETTVEFKPRIAVVLNITPDHLDRHGSFEAYAAAKTRITERQTAEDFLVLNGEDKPSQMVAANTKAQIYWFSPRRQIKQGAFVHGEGIFFTSREGAAPEAVMPVAEIPLVGAHNIENVLAAVCAARLAGVPTETIRAAVKAFKAVEHRLEFVRELNGVRYFNDSKATNVDATVKAVESFAGGVHLILGGKDKDSDYAVMGPLLRERVKTVITIGSAAEKIERQLSGVVKIERAETMERAVALARQTAVAGDTVLLAPACASFDQFENYEHRGRVFKDLVRMLG